MAKKKQPTLDDMIDEASAAAEDLRLLKKDLDDLNADYQKAKRHVDDLRLSIENEIGRRIGEVSR